MDLSTEGWFGHLVFVSAVPVLAVALFSALQMLLRRLADHDRAPLLCRILDDGILTQRLVVALFAALVVLPAAELEPKVELLAERGLHLALIGAIGWTLARATGSVFDASLAHTPQPGDDLLSQRRRHTQLIVFRRIVVLAIILFSAGLALTSIPAVRAVGLSLFASAGVAGIVAGIAARPAVSNLIAGLQLAVTQPVRIGDAVVIEGEWGTIDEITSTYVTVAIWDQRNLVVPLTYFLENPVRNWTKRSMRLLDTVFVYTDYSVPVPAIRKKAQEILESSPLWDRRAWAVQVTDLKDRVMEIRILMSADDPGRLFDLRCLMREEMIAYLNREFPESLPRRRVELSDRHLHASADGNGKAIAGPLEMTITTRGEGRGADGADFVVATAKGASPERRA